MDDTSNDTQTSVNNKATTESKALHGLDNEASKNQKTKNPVFLVLQTIYIFLITIPIIVFSIIEQYFIKPKSLKGQVVLVTGSGRGLGRGFALKFAKLGCTVACVDINEVTNQETARMINDQYPGKAKAYSCNVGSPRDIRALKESVYSDFGQVNLLVHNAALIYFTSVLEIDDFYLRNTIATNLTSHYYMIREFVCDMIKRNEGHYVAISSAAGLAGSPGGLIYAATKHGIVGLMESLDMELQQIPNNEVKTTVICPYFISTQTQRITKAQQSDLRLPMLSVDQVVDSAITGIRKNARIVTVPTLMYYGIIYSKMLPDRLNRIIRKVYYSNAIKVPSGAIKKLPVYSLLQKSDTNNDQVINNAE